MEFSVEREALKQALTWTQSALEKKTTKPILMNILLECSADQLKLSATDMEIGIQAQIPAQIKQEGRIAVLGKNLIDIVRELNQDTIKFSQPQALWLQIASGRSKFKVAGVDPQEFPQMPQLPTQANLTLDAPALKDMIKKTLYAVSTDESKYNLSGLYFEPQEGNQLRAVATDGHRLAYCQRPMSQDVQLKHALLIPRKGILELNKMVAEEDNLLSLFVTDRNLMAHKEGVTLVIRLIDGAFPEYQQVIPEANELTARVSPKELTSALRRVSLLSPDHNRGVKFIFSSGHLELRSVNPDLGEAVEELECDYKGQRLEIGFNYRYFLEVLSVLAEESVLLKLGSEVSPTLLFCENDPGFLGLVMPMRL